MVSYLLCSIKYLGLAQVMSIHVATDGVVCAAPCSLLPQLKQPGEKPPEELLLAIQDAEPSTPLHELTPKDPSAQEMKLCEKAKATTRTKLLALNQSLNHLLNLRLCDSDPAIKLRAKTRSEVRTHHKDESGIPRAYLWCSTTKNCTWQCTMPKDVDKTVRLSSLTDEGETGCALALCNAGLAVMVHRDVQHKLHREEVLAMHDVDEVHLSMRETMLVLKSEFAPWGSGMFGRRMKETLKFVEMIPVPHVLLEICGPGIKDDLQLDPDMSQHDIKQVLVDFANKGGYLRTAGNHKLGRWCDWLDNFSKLKKVWHIKLFFHLLSYTLEGISPFAALAGHLSKCKKATDSQEILGIMPRVLRVSWLMGFGIVVYCFCFHVYNIQNALV